MHVIPRHLASLRSAPLLRPVLSVAPRNTVRMSSSSSSGSDDAGDAPAAYVPYHRAYFGEHMAARSARTECVLEEHEEAPKYSAADSAEQPYVPYYNAYFGSHMLNRARRLLGVPGGASLFDDMQLAGMRAMTTKKEVDERTPPSALSAIMENEEPSDSEVHTEMSDVPLSEMSDKQVVKELLSGNLPHHQLETALNDPLRSVRLRRKFLAKSPLYKGAKGEGEQRKQLPKELSAAVEKLPYESFDASGFYSTIKGTNCENVIGFVPLPVGVVGPLLLDGEEFRVPLATTEGALVASTNRGARAILLAGGAKSVLMQDGMTRAPVLRVRDVTEAAAVRAWTEDPANFARLQNAFKSTSRFGQLASMRTTVAGRNVFLRFRCTTGDAMGMNMISKGVEAAMAVLQDSFPTIQLLSLSGNMCVDKKPSAINWVEGRGKSVAVDALLSGDIVRRVLKTTVEDLVELNMAKNLVGSSLAGSIGGNNAHASNIVTALYLATGQDAAQNVESSTCMTLFEPANQGQDLHISCTMPSVEVGTVGGGTTLPAQAACLEMLGVRGASKDTPGSNAAKLARIVCATVLAGELSLMSALAAGHLVSSHMRLNRASRT